MGDKIPPHADYLVGSPTGLADAEPDIALKCRGGWNRANSLPRGALPGLDEILMLKEDGRVVEAAITMRKHPRSLKYSGPIAEEASDENGTALYYRGPLAPLCGYAPNNVNTMAVLAWRQDFLSMKLKRPWSLIRPWNITSLK